LEVGKMQDIAKRLKMGRTARNAAWQLLSESGER
jgi:hypothetical protein